MRWKEKNAVVQRVFETANKPTHTPYVRVNCPFCLDEVGKEDFKHCLSINSNSGWYSCWRCNTRGRLDNFEDVHTDKPLLQQAAVKLPDGFMHLGYEPGLSAVTFQPERDYLRSRNLHDIKLWKEAQIGACLHGYYSQRIVVPVYSPENVLWGWVSRAIYDAEKKYLNCSGMAMGAQGRLYNQAILSIETEVPVLVVEGVFDALALWPHAVAVLGKPTIPQIETLAEAKRPIVVCLDGDAWRESYTTAIRLRLANQRAGYVRLPPMADPDEVDKHWLQEEAHNSLNEDLW